jgi:hypothetical protein
MKVHQKAGRVTCCQFNPLNNFTCLKMFSSKPSVAHESRIFIESTVFNKASMPLWSRYIKNSHDLCHVCWSTYRLKAGDIRVRKETRETHGTRELP